MAKRDIIGGILLAATLVPKKAWDWGWELARALIGERLVHWLEGAWSWDWAFRLALVSLAIWLLWPRIVARIRRRAEQPSRMPEAAVKAKPKPVPLPNMRLEDVVKRITGSATFPHSNEPTSMPILPHARTCGKRRCWVFFRYSAASGGAPRRPLITTG
jgi:hypothetical protein